MQVSIDRSRCEGTGFCIRLAPEVFRMVDGQAEAAEEHPPADLHDTVEEAAVMCPTLAIKVTAA